ncbi:MULTISPECIES: DUF397 domain-containing protein [Streptomyces]|uniref:DUF397 domain-containing protein n=1 Tax=Streptomyces TaxID=1883 RepID=UPI001D14B1F0|nr:MULTISPECIES: DUF397 domain-containing protein [Streptomyces]MCC3652234.1 DUF397 domain-containing protein [Streptomyces sp. S07_1.15]
MVHRGAGLHVLGGRPPPLSRARHTRSHDRAAGRPGEVDRRRTFPGTVHVRDSKDKAGPQLALSTVAWSAFVSYAARG